MLYIYPRLRLRCMLSFISVLVVTRILDSAWSYVDEVALTSEETIELRLQTFSFHSTQNTMLFLAAAGSVICH